MKFRITLLALALLGATSAQAEGIYTGITYDEKDKVNAAEVHHVYGLNVGKKFAQGLAAELRMEDEQVEKGDGTQKQESLMQVKITKDISTGTMFTPYVAAAVGQKNKSTLYFPYWLGEVGVKAKLNNTVTLRYGWRQRTAFTNDRINNFDTTENTLALTVNLTKNDAIGVRFARERGTTDYDTKGIYYTRSF